jgi:transcriptional regulator with XRE-family HTH domain
MDWTTQDLRNWRKRHQWTKTKAADKLGLTYRYYCMLEATPNKPIRRMLQLAAQYYDKTKQLADEYYA